MSKRLQIVYKKIDELKPYEKNPRVISDEAVEKVANSISEFGFRVPIIIDKKGVIVAGHTRLLGAKKLKLNEVPCILADDLTDEQIKAFRLADNKVGEFSYWDFDLLEDELNALTMDMSLFGFEDLSQEISNTDGLDSEKYTTKTDIPQYEITGDQPELNELVDTQKTNSLIQEIEGADIPPEIKEFLKMASYRHLVFNYSKIAEYYAHADEDVQELMEKSALVIIDFDDAMKYGYIQLNNAIRELTGLDDEEE